jgi:hypothetical protein
MWAFQVAMKEGASIVSEKSQQVADLLLVIELCEGEPQARQDRRKSRTNHHLFDHPSENSR